MKCNKRKIDILQYSVEKTLMEKEAIVKKERKETLGEKLFSTKGNSRKVTST